MGYAFEHQRDVEHDLGIFRMKRRMIATSRSTQRMRVAVLIH